ncbi:MAG: TerB family tellurite resistance protein [Deltaproteobacteria bacterium]|nr:TerB family tellurite resistance protein [Deltaproteobacteria bacterium]
MNIFKLFQIVPEKKQEFGQLFDRISQLGEQLSDTDLKKVTATAGLYGRIAYADTEITPDEVEKIKSILATDTGLSKKSSAIVTTLMLENKVELLTLEEHFYTRLANECMTVDEKKSLLKKMFQIAAADGTICLEEENQLYGVASHLKLSRQEIVELKREFKEYLSVFQSGSQQR